MQAQTNPDVLIVGAGPTGLVLAVSLAKHNVPFRIISEAEGPGEQSRAMVVHTRTLEFYRQFGLADDVISQGIKLQMGRLREGSEGGGGHEVVSFSFQDLGEHLTPFPFSLAYPQDDHERFLISVLRILGHEIEWNTKLTAFTQTDAGVEATLQMKDGSTANAHCEYLCGCDGGHSVVRQTLGIAFEGGTYEQLYYVADVSLEQGFVQDLVVNLGADIFVLLLPVGSRKMNRLIGIVPKDLTDRRDLTYNDLRSRIEPLLEIKVNEVNWFSTYRVHHRVAQRFRSGRTFLSGDAGHVHSPAGGQGMNTGIGDAINLGWKLANVLSGRASEALLDTYEAERIPFARTLVKTTDAAFGMMVGAGPTGIIARRVIFPLFLGLGLRVSAGKHLFFKSLSQTQIEYEDSPISAGQAGRIKGGDRLPWTDDGQDNFAALRSLDWQVHVYGVANEELAKRCLELKLALQSFRWTEEAEHSGLEQDAIYLIRPDGYVALAASSDRAIPELNAYVDHFQLRFEGSAA